LIKVLVFLFICLQFSLALAADVVPSKNARLKAVVWSGAPEFRSRYGSYFDELVGKPWDVLSFKIKIDQISKELFNSGYFTSSVKTEFEGSDSNVIARIAIQAGERTNFQFLGNKVFSHQELRSRLVDKIKNDFGKFERGSLASHINEVYEGAGFYNTSVQSYQNEGKDRDGVVMKNYFFNIEEGEKLKVSAIIYRGNFILKYEDIEQLFKKNATTLAQAGYYDRNFFENFSSIIKKEYLSRGFVFAEVSKPRVITSDEDETLTIEYGISEKNQVILRHINLQNVDQTQQGTVKEILVNKENAPLNVVELEGDLRRIVLHFQSQGYYFATITNLNSETLLSYDKGYANVDLRPEVVLDRQVCFNDSIIKGNGKTAEEVVRREVILTKGELITPAKLELIRQRLTNLGLFSSLNIAPYMEYHGEEDKGCAKTNLVIQVKEKDFGLWEVAPGYRTDLGAKLSAGITYNNLMGMNRSVSFKVQANRRTNLDGFDDTRKKQNKDLLEYLGKISFVEPYLFHNVLKQQFEFESASSFQRKRFYGFDADIFRISPQITKTFMLNDYSRDSMSLAVRYQFERIIQFNATAAKDNDNFSIGGITPSVTLDKRNDPIYPRKGYYLNLSSEWANHYFGSMKTNDLEVNYVKVIGRNKFYYPLGDFTIAFSMAMGYEKNFALDIMRDDSGSVIYNSNGVPRTHGYIPSIKVFRLDGYDEIRGYDEGEVNRLRTGVPIGDVIVQNEAYFTAFKLEPRYNLTDSMQLGVFFDAGRVSVNEFIPFNLRTSVGAGFKFLTPVGSLDFDYGIKLQRKTSPEANRDSFGRFHLSIGYF